MGAFDKFKSSEKTFWESSGRKIDIIPDAYIETNTYQPKEYIRTLEKYYSKYSIDVFDADNIYDLLYFHNFHKHGYSISKIYNALKEIQKEHNDYVTNFESYQSCLKAYYRIHGNNTKHLVKLFAERYDLDRFGISTEDVLDDLQKIILTDTQKSATETEHEKVSNRATNTVSQTNSIVNTSSLLDEAKSIFNLFGSKKKSTPKSNIQSSMYRVMICDNATILRIQLKEILEKCNYEVIAEATNGNEVVDKYFKYKPDLIFIDIAMPNIDGISALKKILAKDKTASVIMCATFGQQQLVVNAMQNGAQDFIIKPYTESGVFDTLAKFDNILKDYISKYLTVQQTTTHDMKKSISGEDLFNEVKTMPIKFDYTTSVANKYQDINTICSMFMSDKAIVSAMRDEVIMNMEQSIQVKRQRNPIQSNHDRSMENNLLYEMYKYSYLMNTIIALEQHKNDDVTVNFQNYWSMIQNDCMARIKNLEQEKRMNPAINTILRKYANDNRKIPMRILPQINARENDYITTGLMNNALSMMLYSIFNGATIQLDNSSSQQKILQIITKYPAKDVCMIIDSHIVNLVVLRTSIYAGGSPLGWNK